METTTMYRTSTGNSRRREADALSSLSKAHLEEARKALGKALGLSVRLGEMHPDRLVRRDWRNASMRLHDLLYVLSGVRLPASAHDTEGG